SQCGAQTLLTKKGVEVGLHVGRLLRWSIQERDHHFADLPGFLVERDPRYIGTGRWRISDGAVRRSGGAGNDAACSRQVVVPAELCSLGLDESRRRLVDIKLEEPAFPGSASARLR